MTTHSPASNPNCRAAGGTCNCKSSWAVLCPNQWDTASSQPEELNLDHLEAFAKASLGGDWHATEAMLKALSEENVLALCALARRAAAPSVQQPDTFRVRQEFLDWNRSMTSPPVTIGKEYAVAEKLLRLAAPSVPVGEAPIPTWKERAGPPDSLGLYDSPQVHMAAEIADLRAALAQQPVQAAGDDAGCWTDGVACDKCGQMGWHVCRAAPAPQQAPLTDARIENYATGSWFDARTLDEMQAFYMSRLPAIREAARAHGYAIGLHGSTRRDFDLMAMQWREDASDKDSLARAIADAACGIRREGVYEWERKPSGRFAVSIPICWTAHDNPDFDKPSVGHIDLSIIERELSASAVTATTEQDAARDVLAERRRQIEQEGWTPEHDDEHSRGELSYAACSYAVESGHLLSGMLPDASREPPFAWPWDKSWWKSGSARRNLVKAGALIIAEIERIDRAAMASTGKEKP